MIRYKIDQSKSQFFDKQLVIKAVGKSTAAVMSKAGAFIRRTARGLIRKRKRTSKPGEPPSSHTGVLKQFIYFAFDPRAGSVVIGPAKTNQVFFKGNGEPVTGAVPGILEHGGSIRILERRLRNGKWVRADLRSKRKLANYKTRLRKVSVAARPYMGPALAKEAPKFPSLFANSIKAA